MFNDNERPFAFGEVYGVRSFRVEAISRSNRMKLTAVTMTSYSYKSGENQATCGQGLGDGRVPGVMQYNDRNELLVNPIHKVACKWCACGFYAYWNSYHNDYSGTNTVTGIIAGYGTVGYSNKGFRASKCKIIAMVNPHLDPNGKKKSLAYRAMSRYARTNFTKVAISYAALLGINIIVSLVSWFTGDWYPNWVTNTITFGAMGVYMIMWLAWLAVGGKIGASFARTLGLSSVYENDVVSRGITAVAFDRVMKEYPEIKWYKTTKEMLKEHPLTVVKRDLPYL